MAARGAVPPGGRDGQSTSDAIPRLRRRLTEAPGPRSVSVLSTGRPVQSFAWGTPTVRDYLAPYRATGGSGDTERWAAHLFAGRPVHVEWPAMGADPLTTRGYRSAPEPNVALFRELHSRWPGDDVRRKGGQGARPFSSGQRGSRGFGRTQRLACAFVRSHRCRRPARAVRTRVPGHHRSPGGHRTRPDGPAPVGLWMVRRGGVHTGVEPRARLVALARVVLVHGSDSADRHWQYLALSRHRLRAAYYDVAPSGRSPFATNSFANKTPTTSGGHPTAQGMLPPSPLSAHVGSPRSPVLTSVPAHPALVVYEPMVDGDADAELGATVTPARAQLTASRAAAVGTVLRPTPKCTGKTMAISQPMVWQSCPRPAGNREKSRWVHLASARPGPARPKSPPAAYPASRPAHSQDRQEDRQRALLNTNGARIFWEQGVAGSNPWTGAGGGRFFAFLTSTPLRHRAHVVNEERPRCTSMPPRTITPCRCSSLPASLLNRPSRMRAITQTSAGVVKQ
jgi:hypothetical protein